MKDLIVGSWIAAEALRLGHQITAATRSGRADALPDHSTVVLDASVPSR